MSNYAIGLLAVVLAGCSDQRTKTTVPARPAVSQPAPPTVADLVPGIGGIVPGAVSLTELPDSLQQPGELQEAWRWPDANGENLLVVFRIASAAPPPPVAAAPPAGPYDFSELQPPAGLVRMAQLSAWQYVRPPGSAAYHELWHLRDFVVNCPLDLTLRLRPGSTAITDLDHNGRSETTLVYALACRSGAGSATLKLILRAGAAKYALRGTTVRADDPDPARRRPPARPCCLDQLGPARRQTGAPGGYYKTEAGFRGAPPAFLRFARQHWRKFSVEQGPEPENQ